MWQKIKICAPRGMRFVGRAVLSIGCGVCVGVVFIHVGLAALFIWLGTPIGQNAAQSAMNAVIADTGYHIHYDGALYRTMTGLHVKNLVISDARGPMIRADYINVRLGLLPLAARQLNIAVRAGHVNLHHLPQSSANPGNEMPAQTGLKTDFYFQNISIKHFGAARLDIDPNILGRQLHVAPHFTAALDVGDDIAFSVDASLEQLDNDKIAWIPYTLRMRGAFNTKSMNMVADELFVQADGFVVDGGGQAVLTGDGLVDLNIKLRSDDLTPFIGEAGQADFLAAIRGPYANPAIQVDGDVRVTRLETAGFTPVHINAQIDDVANTPNGHVVLDAEYKQMPMNVRSNFSYTAPMMQFTDIAATGPDLIAGGDFALNTDDMLVDGRIAWTLKSIPRYAPLINLDIAGAVDGDVTFQTKNNVQGITAAANVKNVRYDSYKIYAASIKASVPDIKSVWRSDVDVRASGVDIGSDIRFDSVNMTVFGAGDNNYDFNLDASGTAGAPLKIKGSASLSSPQNAMNARPNISDLDMRADILGGVARVQGSVFDEISDIKITMQGSQFKSLPLSLQQSLPIGLVDGGFDASAVVAGPLSTPVIGFDVTVDVPVLSDVLMLRLKGGYDSNELSAALSGDGAGIGALSADVNMDASIALYPFHMGITPATRMVGDVRGDFDVAGLARVFLPVGHVLDGRMALTGGIDGTLAAPDLNATVAWDDGNYVYDPLRVDLNAVILRAAVRYNPNTAYIDIEQLSARDDKEGRLNAKGRIDFKNPSASNLDAQMKNFGVSQGTFAQGSASADLNVTGRGNGYAVGGNIQLHEWNIQIPDRFRSSIPTLNIVDPNKNNQADMLQQIVLGIDVVAQDKIFVRGWGLDAEFGGQLDVSGTAAAPEIYGDFDAKRGRYEDFGRRFTLDQTKLRFQGRVPPSPYLDIKATTQAGDVDASVLLTGTVADPKIHFSSVPGLPEDEVMSRILFGKDMSRITPFQAVQLTQTLRRLSGQGGGLDPLGLLRDTTGLDDINVASDEAGDTTVGAGKYLTEKVYLGVENNTGTGGSAAKLQIELTPGISVETKIGEEQNGGGIFWSRDY